MPKRRSVILGLGALAMGSGALSVQATLSNQTNPTANFSVVAAPQLKVRKGAGFASESNYYGTGDTGESFIDSSGIVFSSISPADLPLAYADDSENADLDIQIGRLNTSSEVLFPDLLEVENTGSTTESIGVEYAGGYAPKNSAQPWFADTYSLADNSNITKGDIQQIFQFEEASGSTRLSPDPAAGSEDADNFFQLQPGDVVQLDLRTNLQGNTQVNVLAGQASAGNPFAANPSTDNFQLLDQISVGTQ